MGNGPDTQEQSIQNNLTHPEKKCDIDDESYHSLAERRIVHDHVDNVLRVHIPENTTDATYFEQSDLPYEVKINDTWYPIGTYNVSYETEPYTEIPEWVDPIVQKILAYTPNTEGPFNIPIPELLDAHVNGRKVKFDLAEGPAAIIGSNQVTESVEEYLERKSDD